MLYQIIANKLVPYHGAVYNHPTLGLVTFATHNRIYYLAEGEEPMDDYTEGVEFTESDEEME